MVKRISRGKRSQLLKDQAIYTELLNTAETSVPRKILPKQKNNAQNKKRKRARKKKKRKKYNNNALKVYILPIVFEREIIVKEKNVILNRVSSPYLVSKLLLVN